MRPFVLLLALLAIMISSVEAADAPDPAPPSADALRRVRSQDARVRRALAVGAARSAVFRDVLRRVEANDVIVYIVLEPQLRGRLAGRMRWVAAAQDARYVRVSLNPGLSGAYFVAILAHELQHVAEVGEARSVVDEASFKALYRDVGTERRAHSGAWDTEAAQATGESVRRELAGSDLNLEEAVVASRAASTRE